MRKFLINADDLGFNEDTLNVTKNLMGQGSIKSATILLGYPASDLALRFARDHQNLFSFGLHFNIADGHPLSLTPVPSLVRDSGEFRGPIEQQLHALTGLFNEQDLTLECHTQLSILVDDGIRPSHLNSHGHLHKFPRVLRALIPVMAKFGVRRVRLPQTSYDKKRVYNRLLDRHCKHAFARDDIATTDGFFNTRGHGFDWLNMFLATLPDGVTELGVHPGLQEDWRATEALPLQQPNLRQKLDELDIKLISYHDV